jgi:carbon-monoxide dehydrogenase large subunit
MSNEMITARFGSGQAVNRMEDQSLVEGRGIYTDDVTLERQTHLLFLRSTQAHARIVSIDASAAKAMPGVLLVVTGAELTAAGVRHLPANPFLKRADGKPCQGFTAKAPMQAVSAAPAVAAVQANPSTYLSAFRR